MTHEGGSCAEDGKYVQQHRNRMAGYAGDARHEFAGEPETFPVTEALEARGFHVVAVAYCEEASAEVKAKLSAT